MTWEMLYVAISRATSDNGLRFMPLLPGESLSHLVGKCPHADTVAYLNALKWDASTGVRQF
jgi:hypothetical protein